MTAGMEPVRLPAEVAEELSALQVRGERLSRSSRCYIGIACAAVVVSGIMGCLAWLYGPDAAIKAVHLPDEIAQLFRAGGSPHSHLGNIKEVATSLSTFAFYFVQVLGLGLFIGTVYRFYVAVSNERETPSMAGLIFAPLLFASPWMASALLGQDASAPPQFVSDSPRQAFVAYVEGADYAAAQKALQEIKASNAVSSYMLAQVALAQASKTGKPLDASGKAVLAEQVKQLDEALSRRVDFTVSPQAVYAVEVAAFGKPNSSIAAGYLSDSQHRAGLARTGLIITGLLALVSGLAGGGMLLVGRQIRARLDRILPLLGRTPAPTVTESALNPEEPRRPTEQTSIRDSAWQNASYRDTQLPSTSDDSLGLLVGSALVGAVVADAVSRRDTDGDSTDYYSGAGIDEGSVCNLAEDNSSGAGDMSFNAGD